MSKFHAIYGKGGVSPEPGGDKHGEVQTLLWTNPNTKESFSTKKIELDLSLYNGIIVEYYDDATSSVQTIISRVKYEKNNNHTYGAGYVNSDSTGLARNITTIDDTGVTFGNAFGPSELNNFVIPYRIYGYKQYETGTIEFNWSVSSSTNASESIFLINKYTAPLDGYYKRSEITGFTNATSNLTTEFAYKKAGDEITLNVSKSAGVQVPSVMTIYYSSKGVN